MKLSIESMCKKALKIYHDFSGDSFISKICETKTFYAVFGDPLCRCYGKPMIVFEKESGKMRNLDFFGGEIKLLNDSVLIPVPEMYKQK